MLSFFRINDPTRVVFALLALLAIRLPLTFGGLDLARPELLWMLVGERMASGKALYVELWSDLPPLSAGVYWLLHLLFGRSQAAYQAVSICLVIVQAFVFNRTLIRYDIYKERTYVPALLYVVFSCCCLEFYTLPPVLMAQTFLVLALRNTLHWDEQAPDAELFRTGLFQGVATLFYLPSVLFLFMTLLGLALFRTSSARRLLLIGYGFGFAVTLYLLYQWYSGGAPSFWAFSVGGTFFASAEAYATWRGLGALFAFPALVFALALLRTFRERGFVTYQTSCQQIMVIWTVVGLASVALSGTLAAYQFYVLAPAWSFFVAHYALLMRKRWRAELAFLSLTLGTVAGSLVPYLARENETLASALGHDRLFASSPEGFPVRGRAALALTDDKGYYLGNRPVTPYLDWQLAKRHFDRLDRYEVLLEVRDALLEEPPQVIADPNSRLPELFERLPELRERYHPSADSTYYYVVEDARTTAGR